MQASGGENPELGTRGDFKLLYNKKCYYLHVLLSKFDWGVGYFNRPGLEMPHSHSEIGSHREPGSKFF